MKKFYILISVILLTTFIIYGMELKNAQSFDDVLRPFIDKKGQSVQELSIKYPIISKMINSGENYENLYLTAKTASYNSGRKVDEQVSKVWIAKNPNRVRVELSNNTSDNLPVVAVNDCQNIFIFDQKRNKVFKTKPFINTEQPSAGPEGAIILKFDGTELPISGAVNTNIHPLGYVQGVMLNSDIQKIDSDNYLGRNVSIIELVPKLKYQDKFGVLQKIYVDSDTGIILKRESYNKDGLAFECVIDNINFDSHVKDDLFKFNIPSGAQLIEDMKDFEPQK